MKKFNIRELYNEKYREYIVGSKEIEKHSVYLVYGEAKAGESRLMEPAGHDEILFLLKGEATLENAESREPMDKDSAVYLSPDESFNLNCSSDCIYIVAGTHTKEHSH